jgi:hypothetical protein
MSTTEPTGARTEARNPPESPGPPAADQLTATQLRALAALFTAPTIVAAAESVGVDESTLRVWLREDDAFRAAYQDARRQALEHVLGRIQGAAGEALDGLLAVIRSPTSPPAARVAACRTVLEGARAVSLEEVLARMDQLERLLLLLEGGRQ